MCDRFFIVRASRHLAALRTIRIAVASLTLAAALLRPAPGFAEDCGFKTPPDITVGKELMITDLSVVNDARTDGPDGAWSFGHLMTALTADKADGRRLVKDWLATWATAATVNGFALEARPEIAERIIRPWMTKDGAISLGAWIPDLAHAPFRLLAIVYRPDLSVVGSDGAIVSAGEARFVFTALDLDGAPDLDHARPLPFTLNVEYALPASDRQLVRAWADRWHALGHLPFGADYNAALQAITDTVITRAPELRSNEGLAWPWQLREFHVDAPNRRLRNAPVSNTPHLDMIARADQLSAYLNAHRGEDLPSRFSGGNADVPDRNFRWPALAIANNGLRHNFAMLTCNGCHGAETGRKADESGIPGDPHAGFRHISGRLRTEPATLSEFLTGNPAVVADPTGKLQTFCDLKMRQKALFEALQAQPAPAPTERVGERGVR